MLLGKDLLKGSFIVDPPPREPLTSNKPKSKHTAAASAAASSTLVSPKSKPPTSASNKAGKKKGAGAASGDSKEKEKEREKEKEKTAAAGEAARVAAEAAAAASEAAAEAERIAAEEQAQADAESAAEAERVRIAEEEAEAAAAAEEEAAALAAAEAAAAAAEAAAKQAAEEAAAAERAREAQAKKDAEVAAAAAAAAAAATAKKEAAEAAARKEAEDTAAAAKAKADKAAADSKEQKGKKADTKSAGKSKPTGSASGSASAAHKKAGGASAGADKDKSAAGAAASSSNATSPAEESRRLTKTKSDASAASSNAAATAAPAAPAAPVAPAATAASIAAAREIAQQAEFEALEAERARAEKERQSAKDAAAAAAAAAPAPAPVARTSSIPLPSSSAAAAPKPRTSMLQQPKDISSSVSSSPSGSDKAKESSQPGSKMAEKLAAEKAERAASAATAARIKAQEDADAAATIAAAAAAAEAATLKEKARQDRDRESERERELSLNATLKANRHSAHAALKKEREKQEKDQRDQQQRKKKADKTGGNSKHQRGPSAVERPESKEQEPTTDPAAADDSESFLSLSDDDAIHSLAPPAGKKHRKSKHGKSKGAVAAAAAAPAEDLPSPSATPQKKSKASRGGKHRGSTGGESDSAAALTAAAAAASAPIPPVVITLPSSKSALSASLGSGSNATAAPELGAGRGVIPELLREYFESRGMRRTLASFQQEQGETTARAVSTGSAGTAAAAAGGFTTPRAGVGSAGSKVGASKIAPGSGGSSGVGGVHASPQLKKLNVLSRLRRAFESGDRATFFSVLSDQAPEAARALKRDSAGEGLLFWFQLYFAVFPLQARNTASGSGSSGGKAASSASSSSDASEAAAKSMGEFQRFLAVSPPSSSDPSILPFFGLPYVADPVSHPSFAHLFDRAGAWHKEMQHRADRWITAQINLVGATAGGESNSASLQRRGQPTTRLEKLVLNAATSQPPSATSASASAVTSPEPKEPKVKAKKKQMVRRLLPPGSRSGSRGGSPLPPSEGGGGLDLNSAPTTNSAPFSSSSSTLSPPHASSHHAHSPSASPSKDGSGPVDKKRRGPPPPGISASDVSRKDLHDAMGLASKLSNMLNLLQMDLGSNADALSDAELAELQGKLQNLASKSVVLQKPKPAAATTMTLPAVGSPSKEIAGSGGSGQTSEEGGFVRSQSSAALRQSAALGDAHLAPLHVGDKSAPIIAAPFTWPALHYGAVSDTLLHGSAEDRVALLQALRWRLTRSTPAIRKKHLALYIQNNLLACIQPRHTVQESETLMHSLTATGGAPNCSVIVQEQTARLLNCMSSYTAGRSYLMRHPALMPLLSEILQSHGSVDSAARQHALGALQKFSLSRLAQTTMVRIGIMEWCVARILSQAALPAAERSLSAYSLEYGTALLMNLSLRTAGKIRCETTLHTSSDVLAALLRCLRMEELQFRTYVNGTLYSLLSRRKLRQRARELGLVATLQSARVGVDQRVQQQFDYILRLLAANDDSDAQPASLANEDSAALSEDDEDDEQEHESKESAPEGAQGADAEEEEQVADADDDEAAAALAATHAGGRKAGESFLQAFYDPHALGGEADSFASVPVAGARAANNLLLHTPLSAVPYPLPSSPTAAQHQSGFSPSPPRSPAAAAAARTQSRLPALLTDTNDTPRRPNSPSLPGSSAYFASGGRGTSPSMRYGGGVSSPTSTPPPGSMFPNLRSGSGLGMNASSGSSAAGPRQPSGGLAPLNSSGSGNSVIPPSALAALHRSMHHQGHGTVSVRGAVPIERGGGGGGGNSLNHSGGARDYNYSAAARGNMQQSQPSHSQQYQQHSQYQHSQQHYPHSQQYGGQQQQQPPQHRGMGKSPSAPVLAPASQLPLGSRGGQQQQMTNYAGSQPYSTSHGGSGQSSYGAPSHPSHHQQPPAPTKSLKNGILVPPLLTSVTERRIPPPSSVADPTEKESLTRYYKAFATRAKVGRTPISSAFAEPGEFDEH